jgi:hypothetical protein
MRVSFLFANFVCDSICSPLGAVVDFMAEKELKLHQYTVPIVDSSKKYLSPFTYPPQAHEDGSQHSFDSNSFIFYEQHESSFTSPSLDRKFLMREQGFFGSFIYFIPVLFKSARLRTIR